MPVSRKVVLDEVVKGLPAMGPVFDTYLRYGGFFSDVRVFVFDPVITVKLHEVFSSSGIEFSTAEKAEERAAEAMIRKLEREYKFETKDLNWENMRHFNNDSYNSCVGWRRAEEENQVLRMKVDALTKGWRRSLESIDCGHQHIVCAQSTAFEYCEPGAADRAYEQIESFASVAIHDGIQQFEEVAEEKYIS
ncbi:hypothetical protein ACQ4PT_055175 [Festuca glaucescens]